MIFDQKLAAMNSRGEPRDLFDVAFIVDRYGERLAEEQTRRAEALASDTKSLDVKYRKYFVRDLILSEVTLDGTLE